MFGQEAQKTHKPVAQRLTPNFGCFVTGDLKSDPMISSTMVSEVGDTTSKIEILRAQLKLFY